MRTEINDGTHVRAFGPISLDTMAPMFVYGTNRIQEFTDESNHSETINQGFDPHVVIVETPLVLKYPDGEDQSKLYRWMDDERKETFSYGMRLLPRLDERTSVVLQKTAALSNVNQWYDHAQKIFLPTCTVSQANGLVFSLRGNPLMQLDTSGKPEYSKALTSSDDQGQIFWYFKNDKPPYEFEVRNVIVAQDPFGNTFPLFTTRAGVQFWEWDTGKLYDRLANLGNTGSLTREAAEEIITPFIELSNLHEMLQ